MLRSFGVEWRARFSKVGARLLLAVAGLLVLCLTLPPMALTPGRASATLVRALGIPLRVQEVSWSLLPRPTLQLLGVEAAAPASLDLPLLLRAGRVRIERPIATLAGASDSPLLGFAHAHLDGMSLSLGGLALRNGALDLTRRSGLVEIRGRALGAHGGWVDVSGELPAAVPRNAALRLSLAGLALPFAARWTESADFPSELLRLGGVVDLRGQGDESEKIELDLEAVASNDGSEWLRGTLRGVWWRQAGRVLPGTQVEADLELRRIGGTRELHALHGPVRAVLRVEGTPDRLLLTADLRDLRVRLGELLEKEPGRRARLRVRARLGEQGLEDAHGELTLEGGHVLFARAPASPAAEWRVRTSWLDLGTLRRWIPVLRALPASARGRARFVGGLQGDSGSLRGRVELRALELPGLSVHAERLAIDLGPEGASFECPRLTVAGAHGRVSGELLWGDDDAAPLRLRLRGEAGSVDLDRLARALATRAPPGEELATWEEPASSLLKTLRSRPRLLARLQVDDARLRIDRLTGFGVDERSTELRLELADRLVRIEHRGGRAGARPREYTIDLASWYPRIAAPRSARR